MSSYSPIPTKHGLQKAADKLAQVPIKDGQANARTIAAMPAKGASLPKPNDK